MGYTIELGGRLRARLFQPRLFREGRGIYQARTPELEAKAKSMWAVHGVCLQCRHWSITAGRCVECDITYSSGAGGYTLEQEIRAQIQRAKIEVHDA